MIKCQYLAFARFWKWTAGISFLKNQFGEYDSKQTAFTLKLRTIIFQSILMNNFLVRVYEKKQIYLSNCILKGSFSIVMFKYRESKCTINYILTKKLSSLLTCIVHASEWYKFFGRLYFHRLLQRCQCFFSFHNTHFKRERNVGELHQQGSLQLTWKWIKKNTATILVRIVLRKKAVTKLKSNICC